MKTTKTFIVALLCAVFALPASFAEESIYVGASLGTGTDQFNCDSLEDLGTAHCDDSAGAFRIHVGSKISDHLGVEVGYIHIGEHEYSGTATIGGTDIDYLITNQYTGIDLSLLGMLPLNDSFSVHARGGVFFGSQDIDSNLADDYDVGTALLYGLGGSFAFNENWSVGADWIRIVGADGDIDLLLGGVSYHF